MKRSIQSISLLTHSRQSIILVSLVVLIIGWFLAGETATAGTALTEAQPVQNFFDASRVNDMEHPAPSPSPATLHTLVGSYYLTNDNIDAKLLLNNKGNEPLEVTPTLYSKDGLVLQIYPVTVNAQSFQLINIQNWASLGGESFESGNIRLLHGGKDLVLGAQIYLTDHVRHLSYEEKLAELGKFDSRRQEGFGGCRPTMRMYG